MFERKPVEGQCENLKTRKFFELYKDGFFFLFFSYSKEKQEVSNLLSKCAKEIPQKRRRKCPFCEFDIQKK